MQVIHLELVHQPRTYQLNKNNAPTVYREAIRGDQKKNNEVFLVRIMATPPPTVDEINTWQVRISAMVQNEPISVTIEDYKDYRFLSWERDNEGNLNWRIPRIRFYKKISTEYNTTNQRGRKEVVLSFHLKTPATEVVLKSNPFYFFSDTDILKEHVPNANIATRKKRKKADIPVEEAHHPIGIQDFAPLHAHLQTQFQPQFQPQLQIQLQAENSQLREENMQLREENMHLRMKIQRLENKLSVALGSIEYLEKDEDPVQLNIWSFPVHTE